jgi:L-ascorbate metabolism protein UlaG (beta-lactamase superfamily)
MSSLLLLGCQREFVHPEPVQLAASDNRSTDVMYVQWLGVSSWIVSHGSDVVVVDPFFSRPSFLSVIFSLALPGLSGNFDYEIERINSVLPELPKNTKFVLLGHAHYDHLMDVPYYVERKSGENVTYVGSKTARNILLGFKPERLDFLTAEEGTQTKKAKVRITTFPSDHAPHFLGHKFMSGEVDSPLVTPPTHAGEYVEGQTLVYFIDFLNDQNGILWRVFVNGAASSPDGAKALERHRDFLQEHPTNVAILCVPGWDKVDDYPNTILRLVDPDNVVLSHYDDFGSPYKNGENPKNGMRFVMFANYEGFVKNLEKLKRENNYRYMIHEPKTGQCLGFPSSNRNLTCEQ